MFTISTFFVATYALMFFEEIKMVLIEHVNEPVANRIDLYQERFTLLSLIEEVMFFVEVSEVRDQSHSRTHAFGPCGKGTNWRFCCGVEGLGAVGRESEGCYAPHRIAPGISR